MEPSQLLPPPRDAIIHCESADKAMQKRNDAVKEIHGLGGDDEARRIWKILKGYHRRSLAETAYVSAVKTADKTHQAADGWKYEKS